MSSPTQPSLFKPKPDLFRGAIVRGCVLKTVVDGKTLKVLLNPWAGPPAARRLARGAHQRGR